MLRDYGSARQARNGRASGKAGFLGWGGLFSRGRRKRVEEPSHTNKVGRAVERSPSASFSLGGIVGTVWRFLKMMLSLVVGTVILGLLVLWVGFSMGRYLFPLEHEQTLLFVSSESGRPDIMVHFSPASQSVYFIELAPELPVRIFQSDQPIALADSYTALRHHPHLQTLPAEQHDHFLRSGMSFALQRSLDQIVIAEGLGTHGEFSTLTKSKLLSFIKAWAQHPSPQEKLSWQDKARLFFFVQAIPENHVTFVTVSKPEAMNKLYLLDDLLTRFKNCSVAVVNSTDINGIAGQVSEVLEHTGLRVIRVDDAKEEFPRTTVFTPAEDEVCNGSAAVVSHLLPHPTDLKRDTQVTRYYRADVVIMIESDTADLLLRR